jgi:hypothetical protein
MTISILQSQNALVETPYLQSSPIPEYYDSISTMNQPEISTNSQGAISQPSYNVICTGTNRTEEFSRLELMCRGTRFEVHVKKEDLKSCPSLEQQFLDLLHMESRSSSRLETWMLEHFEPVLDSTASILDNSGRGYSLHDFYSRVIVFYTLKAVNGVLVPVPIPANAKAVGRLVNCLSMPSMPIRYWTPSSIVRVFRSSLHNFASGAKA